MPQTTPPTIWLRRGLGIHDAARRDRADHARHAHHAERFVDPHFDEHRRVHHAPEFALLQHVRQHQVFFLEAFAARAPTMVPERDEAVFGSFRSASRR
jgi:hypothetical protein